MQTLSEITEEFLAGRINKYEATHRTMLRRDAGLCDECPTMLPVGHDHEGGSLCAECRECPECGEEARACVCAPQSLEDICPSRGSN